MNCALKLHHLKEDKFTTACVMCHLVGSKGKMNSLGILCSYCCNRVADVLEIRTHFLFRGEITPQDLKRDDTCFYKYLSGEIKRYAVLIPKVTNKTWTEIDFQCKRCPAESVNKPSYGEVEPTEITVCDINDF